MKSDIQTSTHLIMSIVATIFSVTLIAIIPIMSWELWIIPLIIAGNGLIWFLHIGRIGSTFFYENLCAGLMIIEFFFFGIHRASLFDIPIIACSLILIFSLPDRRHLLYITIAVYGLALLYHVLVLHTITSGMGIEPMMHLFLGIIATAGALELARYRLNRRKEAFKKQSGIRAELEQAGRQNAEFLSNVSHELRTPINMVLGISEVALGKDIPPEIREDMESIQSAGKRLSNEINNILDYTESVEGTLTATKEEYMITSVINDVITTATMQNNKPQLELIFDIDPKIPLVLIGDAEKISHVLKILLDNSIKFTDQGGINVCVGFRKEKYGINLLIDICDTGIGMTSSQIARIHDDFYQADSGSSRFTGGLGLGIPIAHSLLHAMGGFIHFTSAEQEGLQVHITIPQGVANDTPGIVIPHVDQLCIACYFKPERYKSDEVRKYYDQMIFHLVNGLGIEGYQAHNFEGLLKIKSKHKLSHVFIAQAEYMENVSYYEDLAKSIRVVVIADKAFTLDKESKLLVIRKPLFMLSVVNLLNGEIQRNHSQQDQPAVRQHFSCVGVRALAVDDEEMNLVVAKGILGSYGIQIDTCLSGKEAIEKCNDMSYDLIFLDHMMPGMDGIETLRHIREIDGGIYKNLPIVALTANTVSGAREMFKSEGFTEFVPKPIERTVLERVLRRVLPEHCIRYDQSEILPALDNNFPNKTEQPDHTPAAQELQQADATPESDSYGTEETAMDTDVPSTAAPLPYEELSAMGINVKAGLEYCCGEDDFYREMLQMFYEQSNEKKEELISLYETANWTDYAVKVHALKSTSLTIGAEKLSSQAKALEQAGKKKDTAYIKANHPALMHMYGDLCESLSKIMGKEEF